MTANIHRETSIKGIKGISLSLNNKQQPFILENKPILDHNENQKIFESTELQGQSLSDKLFSNDYALQEVLQFLQDKNKSDLDSLILRSICKKELEVDDFFNLLIKEVSAGLEDMKINIKSYLFEQQKKVVETYINQLEELHKEWYDTSKIDSILNNRVCCKSSELPYVQDFIERYNYPHRDSVNQVFKEIFSLIDTPLAFGEVPKINNTIFTPIQTLHISSLGYDNIMLRFRNILKFEHFTELIEQGSTFPLKEKPFYFDDKESLEFNTGDQGWITSIISYPPSTFMKQVGDIRLPFINEKPSIGISNAIIIGSTEGDIRVFSFTGVQKEVYKLGGIIQQVISLPPVLKVKGDGIYGKQFVKKMR